MGKKGWLKVMEKMRRTVQRRKGAVKENNRKSTETVKGRR